MQRTQLDLFSGIGGFALACRRLGIETIGFCEIEPYAQRVLRKNFPGIRIFEDVRKLQTDEFPRPWIITGGYPCQPFSQAGKRRGEEDDRHLWPAMFEIIRSCRPDWVLAENVAGHISMGLDEVLSDLESEDYTCQPLIIPACAVDAPHRRDRVWIVAYAESLGHRGRSGQECGDGERIVQQEEQGRDTMGREAQGCGESCRKDVGNAKKLHGDECGKYSEPSERSIPESGKSSSTKTLAYSGHTKPSRRIQTEEGQQPGSRRNPRSESASCSLPRKRWLTEPDVGRVAHGIPSRVDRLRGLGNAIVPQVAYEIIKAMIEADEKTNESIL